MPYKLTQLSTVEAGEEDTTWLWPGILPAGALGMFDGDPGLGKSMVTMDIAARVTTAAKWPDGKKAGHKPSNVLVIAAEDDAKTMKRRLVAAGGNSDRAFILDEIDGEAVKLPRDIPIIEEIVREHKVRLLIIDPIMAFLEVTAMQDQKVRQAMSPLAKMCQRTGVTALFVRHLTKSGGKNAKQAGGGSMGLLGACRFGYMFAENPDDPKLRVMANTKMNLAAEPSSLGYQIESTPNGPVATWGSEPVKWSANDVLRRRAVDTEEKQERDEIEAFLADYLNINGGAVSPVDLFKDGRDAGFTQPMLRNAKKKLGVRAIRVGNRWYWVENGYHDRRSLLRSV